MLCLDRLPWPWGEEILACGFVARTLVRPRRMREALAWASAQADQPRHRRRLAWRLCANHGRFVARSGLLGVRDPELVRRHVTIRGGERLERGRGLILLGFHLGPTGGYLALRASGHRVAWLGGWGATGLWADSIGRRYGSPSDDLIFSTSGDTQERARLLHRARQIVLEGGMVFVTADGLGREMLRVPVRGGHVVLRAGWLALRRATDARVLPVLSHLEERTHVVSVHPPLPSLDADPATDVERCRVTLGELLDAYVRKFPDQCYSLAFPLAVRGATAAAPLRGDDGRRAPAPIA
jgi:lauroyl/myristoyl acyltransferase